MTQNLVIYDAAYVIDCGTRMDSHKDNKYKGMPLGGVMLLFEKLFLHLSEGRSVAICCDSKSNKNIIGLPEVKEKRTYGPFVKVQQDMVYDFAVKMGIPVYKKDGYASSEMINNVVKKNYVSYNSIDIYCDDELLACNILDCTIRCIPVLPGAGVITKDNYNYVVAPGEYVEYNMVIPYSIFFGCKSRNLPVLSLECAASPEKIMNDYENYCIGQCAADLSRSTLTLFRNWLSKKFGKLSGADMMRLSSRMNLLFPRTIVDMNFSVSFDNKSKLVTEEIIKFIQIFGLRISAMNMGFSAEVNSLMSSFKNSGKDAREALLNYSHQLETDFGADMETHFAMEFQGTEDLSNSDAELADQFAGELF